jgi:hypothetical protein
MPRAAKWPFLKLLQDKELQSVGPRGNVFRARLSRVKWAIVFYLRARPFLFFWIQAIIELDQFALRN